MIMVRLRDETDTTTLFEFSGGTKVLEDGSLRPSFDCKIKRNRRLNAKDILHKKGVNNKVFPFVVWLTGASRWDNEKVLRNLAEAQTTVYLDTEGVQDEYNGKYEFFGKFESNKNARFDTVEVTFRLIENAN